MVFLQKLSLVIEFGCCLMPISNGNGRASSGWASDFSWYQPEIVGEKRWLEGRLLLWRAICDLEGIVGPGTIVNGWGQFCRLLGPKGKIYVIV